jgi:hypothetical protein
LLPAKLPQCPVSQLEISSTVEEIKGGRKEGKKYYE